MIINTIIGHYHNIKINFFYSRPLFLIWYRNQKERKHADRAAFGKKSRQLFFFFLHSCGWDEVKVHKEAKTGLNKTKRG